jgi:hypothetical protein
MGIPWTLIKTLKFKNFEGTSIEGHSVRLKIKTKNYRCYNLMFTEKEQLVLTSIVKNFNSCFYHFTKHFFCFDLGSRHIHMEKEYCGWNLYNLYTDFKMQGIDLADASVGFKIDPSVLSE